MPQINNINDILIGEKCANRGKVTPILFDFVEAIRATLSLKPIDSQARWKELNSFQNTCSKKVFDQKCENDGDCYSNSCDTNTSPSKCMVPYGNETAVLIKCYLKEMPKEMRFEFKNLWNLPATYPSNEAEVQALLAEASLRVTSEDCFGPES